MNDVVLQDRHDTMLELERMKQLDVKALIIQRVLRGYKYRYDTKSVTFLVSFLVY